MRRSDRVAERAATATTSMTGSAPTGDPARARHDRPAEAEPGGLAQPRSRPGHARSSPSSPTSPIATVAGRTGRSRSDEASARASGRSRPGSSTRQAAGEVGVHVVAAEADPGPPAEDRDEQGQPVGVDARRGPARACRSRRRDQRLDLDQQRPAALEGRRDDAARGGPVVLDEERPGRVGRPRSGRARPSRRRRPPRSSRSGSSTRAAGAAPPYRSPSRLSTASTRCSRVLGPAIVPSLVTWPDEDDGDPVALGAAPSAGAPTRGPGRRCRPARRARRPSRSGSSRR